MENAVADIHLAHHYSQSFFATNNDVEMSNISCLLFYKDVLK